MNSKIISPELKDGFFNLENVKLYHSSFNLKWIDEYFNESPKVIIEIGSYDGGDGIRFKHHCPQASIYSIEACPNRFKEIKWLSKYELILHQYVISNKTGKIKFYQSTIDEKYSGQGSILKATDRAKNLFTNVNYVSEPILVDSLTLEDFCKKYSIFDIDILHMDVEGSVKEIVEGFGNLRPRMIYAEIDGVVHYYKKATSFEDIDKILREMNYKLVYRGGCDSLYIL